MPARYRTLPPFLSTLLLLCIIACTGPKRSVSRQEQPAASGKPTMLTLVLKSVWHTDSSVHFSIYNDIRNEGLRPKNVLTRKRSSAFLLCFPHTAGTDSIYIDHPLKEYAETLSQGKKEDKLFIREESYTEISVPYTPDIKKLVCTDLQTQKQQTLDIR